jgi:hypothetical protein
MSEYVNWVGHHNQDGISGVFDNLRDDLLEDLHVSLEKIQAGLAWMLSYTCSKHDDI